MLRAPPEVPTPPGTRGWEYPAPPYPVTLEFRQPERLSRLSTFFRLILGIPLLIFVLILGANYVSLAFWVPFASGLIGFLVLIHWITVLVRRRPVGWAWGTIVAVQRFLYRSYSYFMLLTDRYPPFEGDSFLQYEVEKPVRIQRRQLLFWKTSSSIPHYFILSVLWFAVAVCEVVGWFAILFTGRFPKGLANFVVGWMRWFARVNAYAMSLRDEFPPYSMSATAKAGSRLSQGISGLIGFAVVSAIVALVAVSAQSVVGTEKADVNYRSLTLGSQSRTIDVSNVLITLLSADDHYEFPGNLYAPSPGYRFVELTFSVRNEKITKLRIDYSDFDLSLKEPDLDSSAGPRYEPFAQSGPIFLSVDATAPPVFVSFQALHVVAVFEVPNGTTPDYLTYQPNPGLKKAKFVFH